MEEGQLETENSGFTKKKHLMNNRLMINLPGKDSGIQVLNF